MIQWRADAHAKRYLLSRECRTLSAYVGSMCSSGRPQLLLLLLLVLMLVHLSGFRDEHVDEQVSIEQVACIICNSSPSLHAPRQTSSHAPAVALIMTGRPILATTSRASWSEEISPSLPGTQGTLAACAEGHAKAVPVCLQQPTPHPSCFVYHALPSSHCEASCETPPPPGRTWRYC